MQMRLAVPLLLLVIACRPLGTPVAQPHTTNPWIEARYAPGMRGTPPWRLLITEDGEATLIFEGAGYRQRFSRGHLERIRATLQRVQFDRLQPRYESLVSDHETLFLRVDGRLVEVYAPQRHCGNGDVRRFLDLWHAIAARAKRPRMPHDHAMTLCP